MALAPRVLGFSQPTNVHASAAKRPRVPAAVSEHRTGCSNMICPYRADQVAPARARNRQSTRAPGTARSPRPTTSRPCKNRVMDPLA
ncbi:hypothetical protein Taro_050864 [Colocasia esculenta]|uniref:Uncharacterized protein n=1 Tax=Colocasia esculenta TaxID=4460 RepID=A0A843XF39_COLES|nr:hypothetical protein [Colocasia esculenta]